MLARASIVRQLERVEGVHGARHLLVLVVESDPTHPTTLSA